MGFNFGSAVQGGAQGAEVGASTGNPYAAIALAIGNGLLKGFTSKKNSSDLPAGAGVTSGASGADGVDSQGFNPQMIMQALQSFGGLGGGAGAGQPDPTQDKVVQTPPAAAIQTPNLLGFPSLTGPRISDTLSAAIKSRRGF